MALNIYDENGIGGVPVPVIAYDISTMQKVGEYESLAIAARKLFIRRSSYIIDYINGRKGGVKIYWEGMNYDTTSSTIFSYVGGYQCNHVLVPIATEYVPKTDKLRAKELGFYDGEI